MKKSKGIGYSDDILGMRRVLRISSPQSDMLRIFSTVLILFSCNIWMVAPWTFGFPCAFLLFIHWPSRPVIGTDFLQDMTEGSGFNMLHVGVSNATLKSYHLFHCLALVAMLHDLDIDKSEFWMDCLLCIYQQVSPLILHWLPLTQHSSASSLGCERTRLACLLRIGAHT